MLVIVPACEIPPDILAKRNIFDPGAQLELFGPLPAVGDFAGRVLYLSHLVHQRDALYSTTDFEVCDRFLRRCLVPRFLPNPGDNRSPLKAIQAFTPELTDLIPGDAISHAQLKAANDARSALLRFVNRHRVPTLS